jgi:glyoxylase-like metal-dependent hydrolase (beta-lactamase superfamily II)
MSHFTAYEHGITRIDCGYLRPGLAACYLLVHAGRAAFVDTGTWHTVPLMLEALARAGLTPEAVDYVCPTHVHLDHAGGAGELMRRLPNARLVMHPRGAPHMIDPAKLTAGALAVYGEDKFREGFVELAPVPAARVIEAPDGFELSLNGRRLQFLDTPGHASHHYCIWDETSRGCFTGDTFGISYREFDTAAGPFVFPPTTPVQFKPEAWHLSLDRLLALHPERMFLTHFGMVLDVPRLAADLHRRIDEYAALARRVHDADDRYTALHAALRASLIRAIQAHGCTLGEDDIAHVLELDLDLNTQGLLVWLDRDR